MSSIAIINELAARIEAGYTLTVPVRYGSDHIRLSRARQGSQMHYHAHRVGTSWEATPEGKQISWSPDATHVGWYLLHSMNCDVEDIATALEEVTS